MYINYPVLCYKENFCHIKPEMYALPVKGLGYYFCKILKDVSYVHQDHIY